MIEFKSEEDFLKLFLILLKELKKIHSKNIIHRDIKPENIMYIDKDTNYFCYIDFGGAHVVGGEKNLAPIDSPVYSPPEKNTTNESFHSDIFSLGISLKEIVRSSKIENIDKQIISLVDSMCEKEIQKRPKLDECTDLVLKFSKKYLAPNFDLSNFNPIIKFSDSGTPTFQNKETSKTENSSLPIIESKIESDLVEKLKEELLVKDQELRKKEEQIKLLEEKLKKFENN